MSRHASFLLGLVKAAAAELLPKLKPFTGFATPGHALSPTRFHMPPPNMGSFGSVAFRHTPSNTQRNAPQAISGPASRAVDGSQTLDHLKPVPGQQNSYLLDGIVKTRAAAGRTLDTRLLPEPDQPNTLAINAHGGGAPGKFELMAERTRPNPKPSMLSDDIDTVGVPTRLEDIAKKIGPGTNQIHNIKSLACNADGGCTPEILQRYFPNVTNVVQTPPGAYGVAVPAKPTVPPMAFLDQAFAVDDDYLTPPPGVLKLPPENVDEMIATLKDSYFAPRGSKFDTTHQYLRDGTNWVHKGRYSY